MGTWRAWVVVLVAVMPGGLVAIAAFLLARAVAVRMRLEEGPSSRRLARAVVGVRLGDVWRQARQVV